MIPGKKNDIKGNSCEPGNKYKKHDNMKWPSDAFDEFKISKSPPVSLQEQMYFKTLTSSKNIGFQ